MLEQFKLQLPFQRADLLFHFQNRTFDLQKRVINGGLAVQILVLCQVTEGFALGDGHGALVCCEFSDNYF